jgi:hypothetical protein
VAKSMETGPTFATRAAIDMIKVLTWSVIVTLAAAGCDPGWGYRTLHTGAAQDGLNKYPIPETQGVEGTVSASLFSLGLRVTVNIVNRASEPLLVNPQLLRAVDARGADLAKRWSRCVGASEGIVVLNANQTCELTGGFGVNPLLGPFGLFPNRDLKLVTVFVDGLTRADRSIPLRVDLEWKM